MREWLNFVQSRIADDSLLPIVYYHDLDCDAALAARDRDAAFVAEWIRLFEVVGRRWDAVEVAADLRLAAEDIRKESFLVVSRATRQHEVASYVSDDLDLIVRDRLVGTECRLLGRLWAVYERGQFPCPPLAACQDAERNAGADGEA